MQISLAILIILFIQPLSIKIQNSIFIVEQVQQNGNFLRNLNAFPIQTNEFFYPAALQLFIFKRETQNEQLLSQTIFQNVKKT